MGAYSVIRTQAFDHLTSEYARAHPKLDEDLGWLLGRLGEVVSKCPSGATENSPALQRRVNAIKNYSSPAGTAEVLDLTAMAPRRFYRPSGTRSPFPERLYQARQQARTVPPRPGFRRNRTNHTNASGAQQNPSYASYASYTSPPTKSAANPKPRTQP